MSTDSLLLSNIQLLHLLDISLELEWGKNPSILERTFFYLSVQQLLRRSISKVLRFQYYLIY